MLGSLTKPMLLGLWGWDFHSDEQFLKNAQVIPGDWCWGWAGKPIPPRKEPKMNRSKTKQEGAVLQMQSQGFQEGIERLGKG